MGAKVFLFATFFCVFVAPKPGFFTTDARIRIQIICAQIGGCLLRTNSLANSYADAKTWLNFMLKVAK